MTQIFERTILSADEAYKIIDAHRSDVADQFSVETLDREFPTLARELGHSGLFLARLDDNEAGTFKWRGAMVGAEALARDGEETIVVPSAGNHARGGILAARTLDLYVTTIVPESAPPAKKAGLRHLLDSSQLDVKVVGASFDESLAFALDHPELGALLHPYDDRNVIRGQGTSAIDVLEAIPDVKHIVLPVGGGGLLAGVRQQLDEQGQEDVMVHAIEAEGSNSLSLSLLADEVTRANKPNSKYGGSAVHKIGSHAFTICQNHPGITVWQVSDTEVEALTSTYEQDRHDLWREDTPNYEPTTLVAVAGLKKVARAHSGEPMVVLGTGHNDTLWPVISSRARSHI